MRQAEAFQAPGWTPRRGPRGHRSEREALAVMGPPLPTPPAQNPVSIYARLYTPPALVDRPEIVGGGLWQTTGCRRLSQYIRIAYTRSVMASVYT